MQRQHEGGLEAVHVLRRHGGDDRGRRAVRGAQAEPLGGGLGAGDQRAPGLGVRGGLAGGAGGEGDRGDPARRDRRNGGRRGRAPAGDGAGAASGRSTGSAVSTGPSAITWASG